MCDTLRDADCHLYAIEHFTTLYQSKILKFIAPHVLAHLTISRSRNHIVRGVKLSNKARTMQHQPGAHTVFVQTRPTMPHGMHDQCAQLVVSTLHEVGSNSVQQEDFADYHCMLASSRNLHVKLFLQIHRLELPQTHNICCTALSYCLIQRLHRRPGSCCAAVAMQQIPHRTVGMQTGRSRPRCKANRSRKRALNAW